MTPRENARIMRPGDLRIVVKEEIDKQFSGGEEGGDDL